MSRVTLDPVVRRAGAGALLLGCVLASATWAAARDERAGRAVTPLGTIQLEGSVMHVAFDDAGRRLIVATLRYPEAGRRDELHRYELPSPGSIVHHSTRAIAGSASVALSADGTQVAVGCGAGVCIHDWDTHAVSAQLTARGGPREIGALAFRPDAKLLVGAQQRRMEILTWELDRRGHHQSWVAAGLAERAREAVTPRLHGRVPWSPRWVGISPDASRVGAFRDDGTALLWSRGGELIKSVALTPYNDMDLAFAPDGTLFGLRVDGERLVVVDVDRDRVVVSVEDGSGWSPRRAALLLGGPVGYLAVSRKSGVTLHALPSGEVPVVVPVGDRVWRMAMNGQGRVLAVATQHQVGFWSLPETVR